MAKEGDQNQIRQALATLSAALLKLDELSGEDPQRCEKLDAQIEVVDTLLGSDPFRCAIPQYQTLACPPSGERPKKPKKS
jgi:hypothetical protein